MMFIFVFMHISQGVDQGFYKNDGLGFWEMHGCVITALDYL